MQEENVLLQPKLMFKAASKRSFERKDFFKIKRKFLKTTQACVKFEVAHSSYSQSRLGITVTKKFGNAVKRNRFKRLVREVYRKNYNLFPKGSLVHALALKHDKPSFDSIRTDFDQLLLALASHGSKLTSSPGA